jgi:hypothetical protein
VNNALGSLANMSFHLGVHVGDWPESTPTIRKDTPTPTFLGGETRSIAAARLIAEPRNGGASLTAASRIGKPTGWVRRGEESDATESGDLENDPM